MKTLSFVKMVAAGNDFILIDNRRSVLRGDAAPWARRFCDRKQSIGADGLILLERSKTADMRMRILNSDGSEAEMCGNGVRCLARFAFEQKAAGKKLSIETLAGRIEAEIRGEIVKAKMVDPTDLRLDFSMPVNGSSEKWNFINTGVPHAVQVVESLKGLPVEKTGKAVRFHPSFAPRGANVDFVSIGKDAITIRTYERGVEAETLSCGTGSTAAALVAAALKDLGSPVKVHTQSGETLTIYFSRQGQRFSDVYLEGRVHKSFEGRIPL